MNKRKIIKLLSFIIVGIVIGITGFFLIDKFKSNSTSQEKIIKKEITPLLYEVTKDGSSNKLYLFGSIHVANIDRIEFPKYVIDAYNNSHYLACEFNIIEYQNNQEKVLQDSLNMQYQDNTTLKNHLDQKTYEKLIKFMKEKNIYSEIYELFKPFVIESVLSMQSAIDAQINTNQGIDEYFLRKATEDKKTILEVESSDFQMELSNSFSDKLYNLMFNELIDKYDENVSELKELYQAWCDGNKEKLIETIDADLEINENYTKDEIKLINNYNKKMNDDRNKEMLKKAIDYFNQDKDVFYMVGAAHIISNNGLVNSLKEEGFIVKQITK